MSTHSQSQSHYTPSTAPTSRHHPKNLLHVLRRANAHYSQLAASIRASLTPTHHARKRARALRLQVSTQAARKLEYTQVSVVPLPVLELGPEGGELGGKGGEEVAVERREVEEREVREKESRIVAPIPRRATEMALKHLEEERAIRRAQRPVLRCAIPSVHVQPQDAVSGAASSVSLYSTLTVELTPASASALNAHADVNANYAIDERSRWSCTTIDPEDSHEMAITMAMVMDDEEETQMEIEIPEVSIEHSPVDCTPEMMDVFPRARQHTYAHAHMHPVPVPTLPPTLDVPVDVAPLSWGSDIFSSSFSFSASSSSTTDSSSGSSGLLTPSDTSTEKLTITLRTKRKSGAFDREHEHDADAHADEVPERMVVEEKRPKYGRKEWVTPARRVYPRRF